MEKKKEPGSRANRKEIANSKRLKYAREIYKEVNLAMVAADKAGMDYQQQFEKGLRVGDIFIEKLLKKAPSSEECQLIKEGARILRQAMNEALREIKEKEVKE